MEGSCWKGKVKQVKRDLWIQGLEYQADILISIGIASTKYFRKVSVTGLYTSWKKTCQETSKVGVGVPGERG